LDTFFDPEQSIQVFHDGDGAASVDVTEAGCHLALGCVCHDHLDRAGEMQLVVALIALRSPRRTRPLLRCWRR